MSCRKNVHSSFRIAVEAITWPLRVERRNRHTMVIGLEAELGSGQSIGIVVELWVKAVRGFVPLSKTGRPDSLLLGRDDQWYQSIEGYLEIWETVGRAEVSVHCVPLDQIVSTHAGRVVVKDSWRSETPKTLPEKQGIAQPTKGSPKPSQLPSLKPQAYGTHHVD